MKPSKQNIKDGTYHIDVPVGYAGEVFGKNRQNLEELKDKISLLYPVKSCYFLPYLLIHHPHGIATNDS